MVSSVWRGLQALVDEHSTQGPLPRAEQVCVLCVEATEATGAALSVTSRPFHHVDSTVCGTDALSVHLEELQLGLGEGPIADALEGGGVVLAPDLSDASDPRWPLFAPAAVRAGAAALFVQPLRVGATWAGALSLYRASTGGLTARQLEDLRVLGWGATSLLMSGVVERAEDPGDWVVGKGSAFQPEVHQAVGAVMVHLGVDAADALARLRAHAYLLERPISQVASDVMAGRLRLESDVA